MKKTKFAVLLTAFMAVLGLSSCLGEPDPFYTAQEIMKVESGYWGSGYTFKSAGGYTVEPTNSSLLTLDIDTEYAWVMYKYDTRLVSPDSETIDAEIQGLLPIKNLEPGYEGLESNVAMNSVNETVQFFDKTNFFIGLTYFYENSDKEEDLNTELNQHSFYLVKATAEEDDDVTDNTMVLNLIHQVADLESNEERKTLGTETRHFDLNYVLNGTEPEKIIIKFKQNSYSIDLGNNVSEGRIEVNYKEIVDFFEKQESGTGNNI